MTRWKTYRALCVGLSLAAAGPSRAGDEPAAGKARPPKARLYTNDDLDRVHPFAAETGVRSVPAAPTPPAGVRESAPRRETRSVRQGEAYWRAEAERVRQKLRALDERAAALRARIAERSSRSEVFGRRSSGSSSRASQVASLQASLAALERRARVLEDDLAERARRSGALPGWLR